MRFFFLSVYIFFLIIDTGRALLNPAPDDTTIDEFSQVPYYHLSFIVKRVLPERFLNVLPKASIDHMRRQRGMPHSLQEFKRVIVSGDH